MQMLFSLEEFRVFVENSQYERMPTLREIGNLFRVMRSNKNTVKNIEYYNTIIKSIGNAVIKPGEENCASEFLELLIEKIVREEASVSNVSMDDFTDVSLEEFEAFHQRLNTIRLFGVLVHPTTKITADYSPVGAGNNAIPLQIAWCIHTRASASMQETFNTILRGDDDFIPMRMVVHNRAISKYLILNFGPQGFSLKSIKWIGNGEVQVNELRYALVAMNLFRGKVRDHWLSKGGGHYMSCARRDGVWYLFDDSRVKKTTLQSLPRGLTVTSAIFERIDTPLTPSTNN